MMARRIFYGGWGDIEDMIRDMGCSNQFMKGKDVLLATYCPFDEDPWMFILYLQDGQLRYVHNEWESGDEPNPVGSWYSEPATWRKFEYHFFERKIFYSAYNDNTFRAAVLEVVREHIPEVKGIGKFIYNKSPDKPSVTINNGMLHRMMREVRFPRGRNRGRQE